VTGNISARVRSRNAPHDKFGERGRCVPRQPNFSDSAIGGDGDLPLDAVGVRKLEPWPSLGSRCRVSGQSALLRTTLACFGGRFRVDCKSDLRGSLASAAFFLLFLRAKSCLGDCPGTKPDSLSETSFVKPSRLIAIIPDRCRTCAVWSTDERSWIPRSRTGLIAAIRLAKATRSRFGILGGLTVQQIDVMIVPSRAAGTRPCCDIPRKRERCKPDRGRRQRAT